MEHNREISPDHLTLADVYKYTFYYLDGCYIFEIGEWKHPRRSIIHQHGKIIKTELDYYRARGQMPVICDEANIVSFYPTTTGYDLLGERGRPKIIQGFCKIATMKMVTPNRFESKPIKRGVNLWH